jgi:Putative transposase/Transposase zinc-binding domain
MPSRNSCAISERTARSLLVALADICRRHGPEYRAKDKDRLPKSHLAAMQAIAPCRTAALGGHVYQCTDCGALAYSYHSCKNRHCPTCQNDEATHWLEKPRALLLPVPYFLVPCTLPEELRPVARSHQKRMYNLLFQTSAAALKDLALAPTHLGGQLGMVGVLHTWTRERAYHPHVHDLVPGGALSPDGSRWFSPRYDNWVVPVRARSTIFRGKCKAELTRAGLLGDVPSHVWHTPWVTHCKPGGTGKEVRTSFAPYIRRIAITNNRIETLADGSVTFRCKESASNQWQRRTLAAEECIRRFLQHVLPQGFSKVRYYGFLSPTCRHSLAHLRHLLTTFSCPLPAPHDGENSSPREPRSAAPKALPCTRCGGQLVLIQQLSRPKRAPP